MDMLKYFHGSSRATIFRRAAWLVLLRAEQDCGEEDIYGRPLIEALFCLLSYCGDYETQYSIIKALHGQREVWNYKDWFAEVWFCSEKCRQIFTHLQPNADCKEIRNFLQAFNKHEFKGPSVLSLRCVTAFWNSYILCPSEKEELLWLDINAGSETLTLCVQELPPQYVMIPRTSFRTFLEFRANNILRGFFQPISENADETLHELLIITRDGMLKVIINILHNESEWLYINILLAFISQVSVNLTDEKSLKLDVVNASSTGTQTVCYDP